MTSSKKARSKATQAKTNAAQLTELAQHARSVSYLGQQLEATATRIEDLIGKLCVGCTFEDVYAPLWAEARSKARRRR